MNALMSVDVEDWYQVENLREAIPKSSWDKKESRVEKNVDLILNLLSEFNTKSTFFILGNIAEKFPALIKKISNEGHEIASHGTGHDLVYNLSVVNFKKDITNSKNILENLTGKPVYGYRAPNFSITDWAIDTLIEAGFKYDSSLFPAALHDRYGKLNNYKMKSDTYYEIKDGFYQVLLSCLTISGKNIPWSGGGYFRIIPYTLFKNGVNKILKTKNFYTFYIHPWEFDPGQPRVRDIKYQYRFRHYFNLQKTEVRYRHLIKDFKFKPIATFLRENNIIAGK